MPADTLTITLAAPLADEVRAAAEAADLTPQQALAAWLQGWEEDYRRLPEPGRNIPLDEAFDGLDAKVAAARAKAK